jgi:hypothetical protein
VIKDVVSRVLLGVLLLFSLMLPSDLYRSAHTNLINPLPIAAKATIYRNVAFGGEALDITSNIPELPSPLYREVSSLKVENENTKWVVFWESKNFDDGDDQLWIQGSRTIKNLHTLRRPHGNNHWGDRIEAVSFSDVGPQGDNDNRTVCFFGKRCVDLPKLPGVPVHPGWFVRFCPRKMDANAIDLWVGSDDDQTEHWMVWRKEIDPVEMDFPIRYLYIFTVYLKGQAIPDGQQSSMCVGFQDKIVKKYTFSHDEDHEPDQDGEDNCEC